MTEALIKSAKNKKSLKEKRAQKTKKSLRFDKKKVCQTFFYSLSFSIISNNLSIISSICNCCSSKVPSTNPSSQGVFIYILFYIFFSFIFLFDLFVKKNEFNNLINE